MVGVCRCGRLHILPKGKVLMKDAIAYFIFDIVGPELCVLFCTMIPVFEITGSVPLGVALGLPWWKTFILAVIGNMIPVPFILLFIGKIIDWMSKSRVAFFSKFACWLNRKAEKHRPEIEKYSFWGLFVFIALPLPLTGVWTGSLAAAMMKMNFWQAMLSTFIGMLVAGGLVTLAFYGGVEVIKLFI